MTLRKLPKKKNFKFLDLADPEKTSCEFNDCYKKFQQDFDFTVKTPAWNSYMPFKHPVFFHTCTECGRKFSNSDDKRRSWQGHHSSVAGHNREPFTLSDYKICLQALDRMLSKVLKAHKVEDMRKAREYILKEIEKLENKQ